MEAISHYDAREDTKKVMFYSKKLNIIKSDPKVQAAIEKDYLLDKLNSKDTTEQERKKIYGDMLDKTIKKEVQKKQNYTAQLISQAQVKAKKRDHIVNIQLLQQQSRFEKAIHERRKRIMMAAQEDDKAKSNRSASPQNQKQPKTEGFKKSMKLMIPGDEGSLGGGENSLSGQGGDLLGLPVLTTKPSSCVNKSSKGGSKSSKKKSNKFFAKLKKSGAKKSSKKGGSISNGMGVEGDSEVKISKFSTGLEVSNDKPSPSPISEENGGGMSYEELEMLEMEAKLELEIKMAEENLENELLEAEMKAMEELEKEAAAYELEMARQAEDESTSNQNMEEGGENASSSKKDLSFNSPPSHKSSKVPGSKSSRKKGKQPSPSNNKAKWENCS